MTKSNYIKSRSVKMAAAPKMSKIGGGIPSSSSRARINEAAGVKVKASADAGKPASSVPQAPKAQSSLPPQAAGKAVSADAPHVMPAKHPGAKTTRRQGNAGWND